MELGKRAAMQLKMRMGQVEEATGKQAGKHGSVGFLGSGKSLVWQDCRSSWEKRKERKVGWVWTMYRRALYNILNS